MQLPAAGAIICAWASSTIISLLVTAHLHCRASQVPATSCASVSLACRSLSSSRDDTGGGCLHCTDNSRLPCRPGSEPHPAEGRLHEGDGLALTVEIQRQLLEELLQGTSSCAMCSTPCLGAVPQPESWREQQHCKKAERSLAMDPPCQYGQHAA